MSNLKDALFKGVGRPGRRRVRSVGAEERCTDSRRSKQESRLGDCSFVFCIGLGQSTSAIRYCSLHLRARPHRHGRHMLAQRMASTSPPSLPPAARTCQHHRVHRGRHQHRP